MAAPRTPESVRPDEGRPSTLDIYRADGLWKIASSSGARCWLDLDNRLLVRWDARTDSLPREFRLRTVRSLDVGDHGTVRVGDRHEFITETVRDGSQLSYGRWVQTTVTSIARATEVVIDA